MVRCDHSSCSRRGSLFGSPNTLLTHGRKRTVVLSSSRVPPSLTSRVAVSDVLDLLEVAALRKRFGIGEAELPLLHRWIAAANIRWGLHAEHRGSLELPAGQDHNSWDFGLQRMLLGYAVGAGEAWSGVEPLDEVGGLDARLLGPLIALLAALERHWRVLATPAMPAAWGERLWRNPLPYGIAAIAALVALAIPVLSLQTGMPSIKVVPEGDSSRTGYDQVQQAFGPGAAGPLQIVGPKEEAPAATQAAARSPGVPVRAFMLLSSLIRKLSKPIRPRMMSRMTVGDWLAGWSGSHAE